MHQKNEELFTAITERLVGSVPVRRIVVFGSRARGDATPDSDLDLMVVADVGGSLAERSYAIRSRLLDVRIPMDVVTYTPEEYERLRTWRSSIAAIADREGKVLYG